MKKLLVLVVASTFSMNQLQAEDMPAQVALQMDAPQQVRAGESFVVNLSITNQNVKGFARFHTDLPKGFEAEQIDTENAGAEFSFIDQRVRFIWPNLPETPTINISYRIRITDPRLQGKLHLSGRFTYMAGLERQASEAETETVVAPSPQVEAGQAISIEDYQAENVQQWTGASQPPASQPSAAFPSNTPEASTASRRRSETNTANIFAVRQKPYMVDNEYYVNIQIAKGSLSGSGRIDETLSASVSKIEEIETKGALFRKDGSNTKISFVWTELPQDTGNFVIAYKVVPWQGTEPLSIQGVFTYSGRAGSDSMSEASVKVVERAVDFSVHVPVPPLAAASQTFEAPPAQKKVSHTMQRGLVFKVQLLATRQPVQDFADYFRQQYNINDLVTEEKLDTDERQYPYKYVIGPFRKYEQAQSYRNQVWRKGITDAFVTCYYNGDRITIQEALMISNRKR
ncbi:MAG: hypothetical protein LBB79_07600 [Prevotellaceae bacterium]|jgi:hypothetical protein|nr:hypothetical protein [Prevotellaceae bacterium]